MRVRPTLEVRLLPLAAALCCSASAMAQSAPQVVEISAQKRVENIRDVPLPVTAISGAALEERGIEAAGDLVGVIPNLNMGHAPVSGLIAAVGMRGMASGQPSIWADPAVGMYVDGVFVGKNQGALFDVLDIARLEALRGPQGTLFGRNTAAGAVNFVTRKPGGIFGGNASIEAGSFSRQVGRLSMDLPKMGIVSASIAGRIEKQDGFVPSAGTPGFGSKDRQSARVALRLEPARGVTVDYAYDTTDIDEMPSVGSLISSRGYGSLYPLTTQIGGTTYAFQNPTCLQQGPNGCAFPSPGIGPALRQYENPNYPSQVTVNTTLGPVYQRLKVDGHSLQAEYALSKTDTLRYIGAVRKMRYGDSADYDATPVLVFTGGRETEYNTQSHELQWVGSTGAGLRYVAGAYFFKDDGNTFSRQAGGLLTFHPNVPSYQMAAFDISTDAKALYGQVDMDMGKFNLSVGGRWTEESKTVHSWRYRTNSSWVQQGANTVDLSGEHKWSAFTPSVNLMYKVSSEQNVYARVARGFKSGGFPAEAPVTTTSSPNKPFDPEKATAYELGVKGSAMGGKAQYSANVFRMDVRDYQISLLPAGSISPTIINAGKLRTQGLEIDASVAPTDALRFTLAYGYLDAKFKELKSLSATNAAIDAASNTVVAGAPRHTLSFTTNAKLASFGGMPLRGIADVRYVSERYTYPGIIDPKAANAAVGNSADESRMPALTLVDLRLMLDDIKLGGPGHAEITAYVKNALNQRKMVAHMDVSGFYQVGNWSDPRTYGITLNYKW